MRLPRTDEADERIDTVVRPDVLVVCDPSKLDRRGVRGARDPGVQEFRRVHPADRMLTIHHPGGGEDGQS